MSQVTVTEAKATLSAVLERARSGETITITDRSIPIAHLVPASAIPDTKAELLRLERRGLVRLPTTALSPEDLLTLLSSTVELPGGTSLTAAVLEERESGR
ncbi:MAG: type II toxin-antitoxin system prevent-host-death family antitoxin [Myxococcales bacterium]|nr:type II toxin-antitoxin system prevent-host-death family antitoxin [Myxococcales bacterium]